VRVGGGKSTQEFPFSGVERVNTYRSPSCGKGGKKTSVNQKENNQNAKGDPSEEEKEHHSSNVPKKGMGKEISRGKKGKKTIRKPFLAGS